MCNSRHLEEVYLTYYPNGNLKHENNIIDSTTNGSLTLVLVSQTTTLYRFIIETFLIQKPEWQYIFGPRYSQKHRVLFSHIQQ